MKRVFIFVFCCLLVSSSSMAEIKEFRKSLTWSGGDTWSQTTANGVINRAPAQLDTTFYIGRSGAPYGSGTFDGITYQCEWQNWTRNDATQQLDNYWHVDDFSGLTGINGGLVPLEGAQSMWCGARPDDTDPIKCQYVNLPGYANAWDQALGTEALSVTGDVDLSFQIFWNSETGYDFTYIQWDQNDDNWQDLVPGGLDGLGQWDTTLTVPAASHPGTVRFRFLFKSDGGWSDGDGGGDTDGGCTVDMLAVADASGSVLALEDFEDEIVGEHNGDDWTSEPAAGYGDLANTFHGVLLVQEDPCRSNVTCVWGFFNGSTANYGCASPTPWPEQLAVPYENSRGQYVDQQIWSPWIDITQETGTVFELVYDSYWDLALPNWVFSDFRVRGIDSTATYPCPGAWRGDGFVNYGGDKNWGYSVSSLGSIIPGGSTHIQLSLDVVDYCQYGFPCASSCHSHAPLYDDVSVYRVAAEGPQWRVRDIDQFQDNFPDDGTITGSARADMAMDLNWTEQTEGIVPGDSAAVRVSDPAVGLNTLNGRAHVFIWVSLDGPSNAVDPTSLVCDSRYYFITSESFAGRNWHKFQADTCYTSDGLVVPDDYNFDFCDNLFVPGDTIWFFWGAENTSGLYTYATAALASTGNQTQDRDEAATFADEFQVLPAVGRDIVDGGRGGDILYVDGMNFRDSQPYFDSSFGSVGFLRLVDRYDIRGPSSAISNHPGSRVKNVVNQLVPIYRKILWDCGNLNTAFADGTGDNIDKSNDARLLLNFMDNLGEFGGIYFCGDHVATEWLQMTSPDAVTLRDVYMDFDVVAEDHGPIVGINPLVIGVPGNAFSGDTLIAYGGCPMYLNRFDVLMPHGQDTEVEMNYHGDIRHSVVVPAVLSESTDGKGFLLSGFSFYSIRDHDPEGYPARYKHMQHILLYLGNITDEPVGTGPAIAPRNNLDQNVPNPFNPTTTIKYEVKETGLVCLKVYNVAGQLVRTLVDGKRVAGRVHEAKWNGLNNRGQPVSSGVYFYKLVARNLARTKKMVLLK